MFDKMKQVYEMQKKARELQKQLEGLHVEKASSDGRARVTVNGTLRVERITIDASLLESHQKDTLERTLTTTLNDALAEAQQQTTAQAAALMKGMGL